MHRFLPLPGELMSDKNKDPKDVQPGTPRESSPDQSGVPNLPERNRLSRFSGIWKNNPDLDEFRQNIDEFRRQVDEAQQ